MSNEKNVTARAPQRERGRQRVAELLEAGAAVFAEKGYAAATMTEIAARAQAPIGSLYQFFPGKEALAEALMRRFGEHAVHALGAIEPKATTLSAAALAEALLKVFIDLRDERATMLSVADAFPQKKDASGSEFRRGVLGGIAKILKVREPTLSTERLDARSMAILMQMKAGVAVLDLQRDAAGTAAVQRELRRMLALYLEEGADATAASGAVSATRRKPARR